MINPFAFRKDIREIERHIKSLETDKQTQIAILSKAQSLNQSTGGRLSALHILIIAKSRIIRS